MMASTNAETEIDIEDEDHSNDLQLVSAKDSNPQLYTQKAMKFEPIWQSVRPEMKFHLYSDFYLDLDVTRSKSVKEQMLACSHFKRVVQIKHLVKEQIVLLKNENITAPIKDFRVLTQVLSQQKYKRFKVISKLLKEYQKVIFNYDQQISLLRVQSILNETSMEAKLIARTEYFDKKLKERFYELTQDGAFFTYNKASINIHDGQFQISEQGFSDSLISLLGSDPEQFSTTVMRRGLLSIIEQRNRDIFNIGRLTYEIFEANRKSCQLKGCVASLLTFDEQQITCPTIVEHLFIDYPPELQLQNFAKEDSQLILTEHALIVIYEVSLNTLKQIIATRANNPVFQNDDWVNDFGYSVMSEILLEKFYSANMAQLQNNAQNGCSIPRIAFPEGVFVV